MNNEKLLLKLIHRFDQPIRDPLWNHIYLDSHFLAITRSEPFINLTQIRQLGPTYWVYPGAVHTRASHSIGVFEMGKRILFHLLKDPFCPPLSEEGALSFLAACLLHDTGHFPFTHSLKELSLKEHEAISGELIQEEPLKKCLTSAGASPQICAAIIDTQLPSPSEEITFYRHILSGTLDPDKLDYLNRDATFCGVPYGIQDIHRVIDRMTVDPHNGIGLYQDGVLSVENILFSKYSMYKSVYWHKGVRNATATIKKGLMRALELQLLPPQSLYRQNDNTFFSMVTQDKFPLKEFFSQTLQGHFYHCVAQIPFAQWSHQELWDLKRRSRWETQRAADLGLPTGELEIPLVLDIPEPIHFETKVQWFDKEHQPLSTLKTLFDGESQNQFSHCLREVRLFVHPSHSHRLGSQQWQQLLN